MENQKRSLVKSLSWRILATLVTVILVFIFTGEIFISLGVGAVEVISKLVLYYIHERLWNLVSWGKVVK